MLTCTECKSGIFPEPVCEHIWQTICLLTGIPVRSLTLFQKCIKQNTQTVFVLFLTNPWVIPQPTLWYLWSGTLAVNACPTQTLRTVHGRCMWDRTCEIRTLSKTFSHCCNHHFYKIVAYNHHLCKIVACNHHFYKIVACNHHFCKIWKFIGIMIIFQKRNIYEKRQTINNFTFLCRAGAGSYLEPVLTHVPMEKMGQTMKRSPKSNG